MPETDSELAPDEVVAVVDELPDVIRATVGSSASIHALTADWQGMRGPRGIQGEQGVQGIQGERGFKGDQGERGEQGVQGVQGEQGIQGERGERGPAGATGGSGAQRVIKLSSGPLSMGRVVRILGTHCQLVTSEQLEDALAPVGVTDASASDAGQEIGVVLFGPIDDDVWSFAVGEPVLVGPSGELTQAPSSTWAYARVIGFAIAPTEVFVNPQQPILQVVEGESDG